MCDSTASLEFGSELPKGSEEMQRKGEGKHKVRGAARRRIQRTENGPAVRSGWAWPGLTRVQIVAGLI